MLILHYFIFSKLCSRASDKVRGVQLCCLWGVLLHYPWWSDLKEVGGLHILQVLSILFFHKIQIKICRAVRMSWLPCCPHHHIGRLTWGSWSWHSLWCESWKSGRSLWCEAWWTLPLQLLLPRDLLLQSHLNINRPLLLLVSILCPCHQCGPRQPHNWVLFSNILKSVNLRRACAPNVSHKYNPPPIHVPICNETTVKTNI